MPTKTEPRALPSHRTRYRYILFRLTGPTGLSRNEVVQALRKAADKLTPPPNVWLTRYDGVLGVVRCPRDEAEKVVVLVREGLASVGLPAEPISTSGTIAALERRHRALGIAKRRN